METQNFMTTHALSEADAKLIKRTANYKPTLIFTLIILVGAIWFWFNYYKRFTQDGFFLYFNVIFFMLAIALCFGVYFQQRQFTRLFNKIFKRNDIVNASEYTLMNTDIDSKILSELYKIRKTSERGTIVAMLLVLLLIPLFCYYIYSRTSHTVHSAATETQIDSWNVVQAAMDHFEYKKASEMAHRLIAKYPKGSFGYQTLGYIALEEGNLQETEKYWTRAYELLPTEQHEKLLEAIRKRIAMENSKSINGEQKQ